MEFTTIARARKISVSPQEILETVQATLDDNQAIHPVVVTLHGKSSIADFMVIASGRSSRHVASLAQHVVEKLKALGVRPRAEGMAQADWVLIDGGDVVVHLFRPEVRAFYNLEKMWGLSAPPAEEIPADSTALDEEAAADETWGQDDAEDPDDESFDEDSWEDEAWEDESGEDESEEDESEEDESEEDESEEDEPEEAESEEAEEGEEPEPGRRGDGQPR